MSNERREKMPATVVAINTLCITATAIGLLLASAPPELIGPDGMLYAASLAGAIGGGMCSLMLMSVMNVELTPFKSLLVFSSNAAFGLTFGPVAVDPACHWLSISPTFQSAVAVSGAMSGFISGLTWNVAPQLLKWSMGADWPAIIAARLGFSRSDTPKT
jgi:hypothetical protein